MEAFCAEHKVDFDDVLYGWPSSKFEALYSAFAKRTVANQLAERRNLELAALWGNTNLDNEKKPNLRQEIMEKVDESYSAAINNIYDPQSAPEIEVDEDDPFWKAMERGIQKYHEQELPDPKLEDEL